MRLATDARHWVLLDQMLVSGSNFLIALVLARAMGPAAFGVYALITAVQQFCVGLSTSLVANPVGMALPHADAQPDRQVLLAGGHAIQLFIGGCLAAVTAVVGTVVVHLLPAHGVGMAEIGLLCVGVASLPLLEWYRKMLFVRSAYRDVFIADACLYGPLLPTVALLAMTDRTSVAWVMASWAGCSLLAVVWGYHSTRTPADWRLAREHVRRQWRASLEWVAATQIQWLGSQGVIFVAAPLVGVAGIGAYRSAVSLLGFTNAIGQMLDNTVSLRSAEHYAKSGEEALRTYLYKTGLRSTLMVALIVSPFVIFPEWICHLVLGSGYVGYESLLPLQAIYTVLLFGYRSLIFYRRAKLQTRMVAHSAVIFAASSIAVTAFVSSSLGPMGIVLSTVTGVFCSVAFLAYRRA